MFLEEIQEKYLNQGYDNSWQHDWESQRNSAFMCAFSFVNEIPGLTKKYGPMGFVEYWKEFLSAGVYIMDVPLKGAKREDVTKESGREWLDIKVTTPMLRIAISVSGIETEKLADKIEYLDMRDYDGDSTSRDTGGFMYK